MATKIQKNPYIEKVKLIRSMASARYGHEILASSKPSGWKCWRFNHVGQCSAGDDPLCWRLDTWTGNERVSAYCIFDLDESCTEEVIESRFTAMEISREEYIKSLN